MIIGGKSPWFVFWPKCITPEGFTFPYTFLGVSSNVYVKENGIGSAVELVFGAGSPRESLTFW